MADFTAVIRRAVEGLPEQTPELRARVYDKARSAVIRQMENMNPPPPEALIRRQIDKIDAAIAEVESDFAVAIPAEDEELAETAFHVEDAPTDEAPVETYPEPEPEPEPEPPARSNFWDDAPPEAVADELPPEPVGEPEPERRTQAGGFLQGATFEAVNHPDRVVYEEQPDPEEEASYSFETPEEPEDDDTGSVIVESDTDVEPEEERRGPESWHYEPAEEVTPAVEPVTAASSRSVSEKDWAHVDSLLGLEPEGQTFEDDDRPDRLGRDDEDEAVQPGRGRRIGFAVAGVVILAIVIVGGFFAWQSRDDVMAVVAPTDQETPAEATSGEQATSEAEQTPAAESAEATGEKRFTQRLLPDGTEVDEGLPAAGASAGPARSVASQTSGAAAASGSAQETAAPAPPVGSAQKMFLYEEQLGQSVPSAYQGSVTWELKQENTGTAVSEPVVEGVMNVPDAGLSGVITFRRNDDSSLPASHLIDIAFTLDDTFQGGAVDNVQRMSLKSTEAARGDPLIAVTAKITDDLYMLALNDFDQARSQNLALLAERNWIDIPITYRNGRRALLTLEKGTTGMAIFDRAVQEWQALGDIGDNN